MRPPRQRPLPVVITILGLKCAWASSAAASSSSPTPAIPGMGQLFYGAVMARDYPLVMGELVIGAVLTLVDTLVDLGDALVDPVSPAG